MLRVIDQNVHGKEAVVFHTDDGTNYRLIRGIFVSGIKEYPNGVLIHPNYSKKIFKVYVLESNAHTDSHAYPYEFTPNELQNWMDENVKIGPDFDKNMVLTWAAIDFTLPGD